MHSCGLNSYGLHSYGLHSYGLYGCGLNSYGLYSHGAPTLPDGQGPEADTARLGNNMNGSRHR